MSSLLFRLGLKHGFSRYGKSVDWEWMGRWCSGE